ncbi:MAG TPA: hypothetical protein VMM56_15055 [Planctomycetaceae bacterium]|nr:hypothetical protein [Planctomycetaceae bacterium]
MTHNRTSNRPLIYTILFLYGLIVLAEVADHYKQEVFDKLSSFIQYEGGKTGWMLAPEYRGDRGVKIQPLFQEYLWYRDVSLAIRVMLHIVCLSVLLMVLRATRIELKSSRAREIARKSMN